MKNTKQNNLIFLSFLAKTFKNEYGNFMNIIFSSDNVEAFEKMFVNGEAQREKIPAHVKELTEEMIRVNQFNTVITLAYTSIFNNGKHSFHILDGQHRVWAALEALKLGFRFTILFKVQVVNSLREYTEAYTSLNGLADSLKTKDYKQAWIKAGIPAYVQAEKFINDSLKEREKSKHSIADDTLYKVITNFKFNKKNFKKGLMEIENSDWKKQMKQMFDIQDIIGNSVKRINKAGKNTASFAKPARALARLVAHDDYNHTKALRIIKTIPNVKFDLNSDSILYSFLLSKLGLVDPVKKVKTAKKTPLKKQASKQKLIGGVAIVRKMQTQSRSKAA